MQVQKFLFHYRITPIREFKQTPAERMFGHDLRSRLDLLFPKVVENKNRTIECNGTARIFKEGDRVSAREYLDKTYKWKLGVVCKKLGQLHYLIKLENGKIWKRHVNQLRASKCKMRDSGSQIDLDCNVHERDHLSEDETIIERERPVNVRPIDKNICERNKVQSEQEGQETSQRDVNKRPQRGRKPPARYADFLSPF